MSGDFLFQWFAPILIVFLIACNDKINEEINPENSVENLYSDEVTFNVTLTYSDSANAQVRITSPVLERKTVANELVEVFPEGLHVEFLNQMGRVSSYLDANYATRYERKGIVIAEDSVIVYNKQKEKLETSQLTWDEKQQNLRTPRFVRITMPEKGDTIYGFGLTADQEFSRFELKEVSGKSKFENLVNSDI